MLWTIRFSNQKDRRGKETLTILSKAYFQQIFHNLFNFIFLVTGIPVWPLIDRLGALVNHPRDIWRINGLTGSRSPLLQFPTLGVMTKKQKINQKKKKYKSLSIYLNSKRRHEASDVELPIVQLHKKLLGIWDTISPWVLFSHGVWRKHELRRVHRNR